MARVVLKIFFGLLILQWVSAAPSEITIDVPQEKNIEADAEVKPVTLLEESNDNEETQGQRQKRWYNFYGFPPTNPIVYKRDEGLNTGVYGYEDPFVQIHRKLQEINSFVRQPALPPLPPPLPQFPSFIPVVYLPHFGCACTPDAQPNTPTDNTPAPPQDNNNQTIDNPDVTSRWPDMEDERQNWGFVLNDTDIDDGDDGDGSRPISFEPIRPNRTMSRPPPPVEHGSSQGGANTDGTTTTTTTTTSRPAGAPTTPRLQPPSACDGAILSCCHMPQVTYDCFAVQGCPDPSSYGNPCDSGVILRVIERFQMFYNQRNG